MTILFQDRIFEFHQTGHHPESPMRTKGLMSRFQPWIQEGRVKLGEWQALPESLLLGVHTQEQVDLIKRMTDQGGGALDADTVLSPGSWQAALAAAGTVVSAVDAVVRGKDRNALCLIRPPGHHATEKQSMGFCLFNNVALGAKFAQQVHQLDRILIVDWDVHHGNGTQDIFYEDESVFFFSIHRFPFYPGTGHQTETGQGRGLGTTLNRPLAFQTSRQDYLNAFRHGLESAVNRFKPDLILISAGFDAHKDDPVGSLGLETEDFRLMTEMVLDVAKTVSHHRVVSCLEGGYNLSALADSVEVHLDEMAKMKATT